MLRKITIAVDCADDAERDRVQEIATEISNMRILDGRRLTGIWPYVQAHKGDIQQLFSLISEGGIKALVSGKGIQLLTRLTK
jgi:hypothetical protein